MDTREYALFVKLSVPVKAIQHVTDSIDAVCDLEAGTDVHVGTYTDSAYALQIQSTWLDDPDCTGTRFEITKKETVRG